MQHHKHVHMTIRLVILLVFLCIAGIAGFFIYSGYCGLKDAMPGHLESFPNGAVSGVADDISDDGL